jgi:hypothetical protein
VEALGVQELLTVQMHLQQIQVAQVPQDYQTALTEHRLNAQAVAAVVLVLTHLALVALVAQAVEALGVKAVEQTLNLVL